MNKNQTFADNLNAIRRLRRQSISAFAAELDIPKSTLQSLLAGGQTSLYTALHIASMLHIPLDRLTCESAAPDDFLFVNLLKSFDFLAALPADKQKAVAAQLHAIIDMICD